MNRGGLRSKDIALEGPQDSITDMVFNADGSGLVVSSWDGGVRAFLFFSFHVSSFAHKQTALRLRASSGIQRFCLGWTRRIQRDYSR